MQDRKFRSQEELNRKKLNNFFVFKDRNFFRCDIYKEKHTQLVSHEKVINCDGNDFNE